MLRIKAFLLLLLSSISLCLDGRWSTGVGGMIRLGLGGGCYVIVDAVTFLAMIDVGLHNVCTLCSVQDSHEKAVFCC